LGAERHEAGGDAQFLGDRSRVVAAAGTPAVQLRTVGEERADVGDGAGYWDALRADRADERVVHVDVDNQRRL
jgi:hypothetical protein